MIFNSYTLNGKTYNLDHLKSFDCKIEGYNINVTFSFHCFTQGINYTVEDALYYKTPKDNSRIFCNKRYELSKQLPEIISKINEQSCWFGKGDNFLRVEYVDIDGVNKDYEIYFNLFKSRKGWLSLKVFTAFPRDEECRESMEERQRIKFKTIAKARFEKRKLKRR
jgi:hypothetical protein